jgi:hypothetical protein
MIALGACSAARSGVELTDAFDLAVGPDADAVHVLRIGGLSGLAVDRSGQLLAVSDDRARPRVVTFRVHERPFRVQPTGMIALRKAPLTLDAEAIAVLSNGHLLIASEGIQGQTPRIMPAVLEFSADGEWVRSLPVRSRYLPPATGTITSGARGNAAFESLTLVTDESRFFTAIESPLVQDGEPANFEHGARVRILEYTRQGETFVPGREWAYDTDRVEAVDFPAGVVAQGLVELVALSEVELLALERSYVEEQEPGKRGLNSIRVYRVSLDEATDVSHLDSIADNSNVRPASKRLVADLSHAPGLPQTLAELDNFEGMTLLPSAANGGRNLLIVSDNNFSDEQRTWFLRLKPGNSGAWSFGILAARTGGIALAH